MLSIKGVSEWVNYIVQCKLIRKDTSDIIEKQGYDIRRSAEVLKNIYNS